MSYKHSLRDVIDCCVWPNDGPRLEAPKGEGVPQQLPVARARKGARVVVPVEARAGSVRQRIYELLFPEREMTSMEIAAHLAVNRASVAAMLSKMLHDDGVVEVVNEYEKPWRYRIAALPAGHRPLSCGCDDAFVCKCKLIAEAAE